MQSLGTRFATPDPPDDATAAVVEMLAHAPRAHSVRLRVHTSADLVRSWAARWVVYRNLDVDVLEPVALQDRLRELGGWLAERYADADR